MSPCDNTGMSLLTLGRPNADEYLAYYEQYIQLVPDGNIVEILGNQFADTHQYTLSFDEFRVTQRPTPSDWSILQVLGHLIDTERVMAYRALRLARGDIRPLAGVEFDGYVQTGGFEIREVVSLMGEFAAVRASTVLMLGHLDDTAWRRHGMVDGDEISVRALAYIIAGHELHHVADFKARY